jgi:hypothetical protein
MVQPAGVETQQINTPVVEVAALVERELVVRMVHLRHQETVALELN